MPHTGFVTRRMSPPENREVLDSAVLFIEPGKSLPVRKNIKNGQEVLCVLGRQHRAAPRGPGVPNEPA